MGSVEESEAWMARGEQALQAAGVLLDKGFYREVMSHSYYAMFYAAKAALALLDIHVHKHSAVIAAFGGKLANPGLVPRRMHRVLIVAFKDRGGADYELGWEPTREKAQSRLREAEQFVSEIRQHLRAR